MMAFIKVCGIKRQHATKAMAEAWIKANANWMAYRLKSYCCPACGCWHTGRKRQKIRG